MVITIDMIIAISKLKKDCPAISPKTIQGAKANRSLIMFIILPLVFELYMAYWGRLIKFIAIFSKIVDYFRDYIDYESGLNLYDELSTYICYGGSYHLISWENYQNIVVKHLNRKIDRNSNPNQNQPSYERF